VDSGVPVGIGATVRRTRLGFARYHAPQRPEEHGLSGGADQDCDQHVRRARRVEKGRQDAGEDDVG
jgi:hypothetical protein